MNRKWLSKTKMMRGFSLLSVLFTATVMSTQVLKAEESAPVLRLYSARHYSTDELLYTNFTKKTGIRIERIDADDAGILARLKTEGASSPADVILLVDAARLWQAELEGLFLPVKSALLESRIPETLRAKHNPEGTAWFGFSTRARVIAYDKSRVNAADVDTYEKLADPKLHGLLCTRSGSHPYNLSLFGAMLEHLGAEKTQTWLKGMVDNMARKPKGGDTDQIKALASGECGVTIANTYYLARLMRSNKPEDKAVMNQVGIVFPNQSGRGTHVNVAGGAVARHTKQTKAAVAFLEYLASPEAQAYFANGNNEWPAAKGVKLENPALESMIAFPFKTDGVPARILGMNQIKVQQMLDKVGYQ